MVFMIESKFLMFLFETAFVLCWRNIIIIIIIVQFSLSICEGYVSVQVFVSM